MLPKAKRLRGAQLELAMDASATSGGRLPKGDQPSALAHLLLSLWSHGHLRTLPLPWQGIPLINRNISHSSEIGNIAEMNIAKGTWEICIPSGLTKKTIVVFEVPSCKEQATKETTGAVTTAVQHEMETFSTTFQNDLDVLTWEVDTQRWDQIAPIKICASLVSLLFPTIDFQLRNKQDFDPEPIC